MHLKKHSLRIEKYNFENRDALASLLKKHQYFQDLDGYSFELFPSANIFLLRGSTWIYKDIIIGFCVIIDYREATTDQKYIYAQVCKIDYEGINSFNGIVLEEIGIMPQFRNKGLGVKLFNHIKSEYQDHVILLQAMESAVGFWEKMGFSFVNGTKKNNMILEIQDIETNRTMYKV